MSTSFHPAPIPWSEFPTECFYYLLPMSVLHLVIFIIGFCVVLFLPRKMPGALLEHTKLFALFLLMFLFVGAIFNGFWSCLIWGRLYNSTDYFFDFMPFWPITQRVIDAPWGDARGQLLGVSLIQLQLVWLLFAISTWGCTFTLFRFLSRKLKPAIHER